MAIRDVTYDPALSVFDYIHDKLNHEYIDRMNCCRDSNDDRGRYQWREEGSQRIFHLERVAYSRIVLATYGKCANANRHCDS